MNIKKRLREIESQIDKEIYSMEVYNLNKDTAIITITALYELNELKNFIQDSIKSQSSGYNAANVSSALRNTLFTAVELINEKCPNIDGKTEITENEIKICYDFLEKSNIYSYVVENYKGLKKKGKNQGLLEPFIVSDTQENITLKFQFTDENVYKYECINSLLLDDYNNSYIRNLEILIRELHNSFPTLRNWRDMDSYYSAIATFQVNELFNYPNEMKVAKYKIEHIKIVWYQLLYNVYMYSHRIRKKVLPLIERDGSIPIDMLNDLLYCVDLEKFDGIESNIVESILNDLAFGTLKGKQNYNSFITEPIIKTSNGKMYVSPTLLSHSIAGRNIIACLNRIYEGTVDTNTSLKEHYFFKEPFL